MQACTTDIIHMTELYLQETFVRTPQDTIRCCLFGIYSCSIGHQRGPDVVKQAVE